MEVVSGYVKPNRQWKVDQSKHDSADACVGFCTADRRRSERAHRPRGRTDRRVVAKGVGGGGCKEEERNREPRRQCTGRQQTVEKTADDPTNQPQRTHATTNRGITVLGQRAVLHQSHCSDTRSRIATFKKEEWVSLEWRHNYQKTTFLDSALVG